MSKSKFNFNKFGKKMNIGRLLLIALVAVSFFGFLLWCINQVQTEEETIGIDAVKLAKPLENKIIKIESPKTNANISNPVTIEGRAAITGGTLRARLKDTKGLTLGESVISVKSSQRPVPFSINLAYKKPTISKGTLEIFRLNSKDKTETYKLSIPVTFKN